MSSMDNLKEAFAGESQANRKYLAFAKKADEDGFKQIAKLFRAAAAAETVHAHNHLEVMGGINSTQQNLEEAITGEKEEFESMYPVFIEKAKADGNQKAIWTFDVANQVEEIHASLYQNALENIGENKEIDYYVCEFCGNTVEAGAPDKCAVCGATKEHFFKVD